MKRNELLGKTFLTNNGAILTVERIEKIVSTETYYLVRFQETGSLKVAEKRNIIKGNVKDDYHKNIFGIACKGKSSSTCCEFNKKAFKRWYAMIERCYNKSAFSYKSYGAKGVTVSEEWLCFDNFIKDIKELPGYDEKKYISGEIQLDKDAISGNKVYSRETCVFVGRSNNASNQPSKKKIFSAISPDGKEYFYDSQVKCAKENNLTARTIGKVLNSQLKTHKGWKFSYVV